MPGDEEKRRRDAPAAEELRGGLGDPKDEPRLALTPAERVGGELLRGATAERTQILGARGSTADMTGACRPGTPGYRVLRAPSGEPTVPECCAQRVLRWKEL